MLIIKFTNFDYEGEHSCVSWSFVFSLMNYLFILILYSVFVVWYFVHYFDYIWSVLFVVSILPGLYLLYEKQKVLFLFRIINYLCPWYSVYKVLPHLKCEKHLYFLLVYYFISFLHWTLEFMLNSSIFWWVALGRNLIFSNSFLCTIFHIIFTFPSD